MKSIWKGAISFGLVSIPVQLYSATEEHGVSFRQVHAADGGRIRYRRFCELEDREVQYAEITRAYETEDGELVVLTPEDLAELPLPSKKIIDVVGFEEVGFFDPIQFSRAYYVKAADAAAAKPYVLLREALKRSGRVAVVKVALRNREAPALVRVLEEEDVLVLHTMLWPDEVRSAQAVAPDEKVTVRRQELDMVDSLMDALGGYDPEEFTDEYREAVEALVASKEGIAPLPKEAAAGEERGQVIDLMSALEASVQAARDKRGGTAAPRKKAAAKKTTAKKTAGTKTTGTKTAGTKKTAAKKTGTAGKKTAAKTAGKKTAKKTTRKPGKAA
ncbi:non-homologous end joining protein Ku [Streptomyces sp. CMB-StM0423]|uniref:non-homologous end joining protein Ku n=1 Tax=Streptomyces sp. CMB-StM0423 TaxID=2059884 RepID=UPI000C70C099|nr:Ku protein [Streptomyces sp. CMB-StM0423]AUH43320.1 Ku protein [Streptomyces sp. CMB-StM0423]